MKLLTKSRFKLGLECPNKLFYTRKKEYANKKQEDSFLQALAQGGFQVEELARMHYPNGILIEGNDWDYELLWKQTQKLLEQENVIVVCNFSSQAINNYRVGVPASGNFIEIFNTDATKYGGSGFVNSDKISTEKTGAHAKNQSIVLKLPPLGMAAFKLSE